MCQQSLHKQPVYRNMPNGIIVPYCKSTQCIYIYIYILYIADIYICIYIIYSRYIYIYIYIYIYLLYRPKTEKTEEKTQRSITEIEATLKQQLKKDDYTEIQNTIKVN